LYPLIAVAASVQFTVTLWETGAAAVAVPLSATDKVLLVALLWMARVPV
jgi:hypothetical protein